MFLRDWPMPPVERHIAIEIIAQALRRRRTGRPVYDLRGDAGMVVEGLREAGLTILAVPRLPGAPQGGGEITPPANAGDLAELIAGAIERSLLAARWDARTAAAAVLHAMRTTGQRVRIEPPQRAARPRLVFSRDTE